MSHGLVRRESVDTEMQRTGGKPLVYTTKRGFDVTRSPLLNKVSADTAGHKPPWSFHGVSVKDGAAGLVAAFRGRGKSHLPPTSLWSTSPLRSQSQHNLLIDAEGRSAESSLHSPRQDSISF
ncbi:unnamed protein product [Pleuronectes platessa]|uniref:Uncharacterized protein n=1 Tax=Pleuronectes platessa TaxID=8262 RepID=A0A9N7UEZ6_PLEPL|nr:unnamed protein product [Pleuronectes platessa]